MFRQESSLTMTRTCAQVILARLHDDADIRILSLIPHDMTVVLEEVTSWAIIGILFDIDFGVRDIEDGRIAPLAVFVSRPVRVWNIRVRFRIRVQRHRE